jgi:transposase
MKSSKRTLDLTYNAQITVDHKLGIIVANDVSQDRIDTFQLKPQIKLVEENCGLLKEGTKICADNGDIIVENVI